MGRAHRNSDTFPRLADPLGYVDKDDILHAVKAIVATQRDYGRRDDRKQVRLAASLQCTLGNKLPWRLGQCWKQQRLSGAQRLHNRSVVTDANRFSAQCTSAIVR